MWNQRINAEAFSNKSVKLEMPAWNTGAKIKAFQLLIDGFDFVRLIGAIWQVQ